MQRSDEFTLRDMIFLLRKRIVMICMVTILAVLLSVIFSICLIRPVYECRTSLIVSVEPYGTSGKTSAQIADTFGYFLKSRPLLSQITQTLGLNLSADKLAEDIDFAEIETTGIYTLTVRAGDDALAEAITAAVIEYVPAEISRSFKTDSIEIITLSSDTMQISPNIINNTVTGFFIGFALSCMLSLLPEILNNKIRTSEDIKNKLGYTVVGVIPKAAGTETPQGPVVTDQFFEPFNALQTVLRCAAKNKPVKKIMIVSPVSGDGRTTVALNLASVLAAAGRNPLVIDADFRNSGISGLQGPDGTDRGGLSDILSGVSDLTENVRDLNGVAVLPSGTAPYHPGRLLYSAAMRTLIKEAEDRFDVIVFDTPPLTRYSDAITLLPRMDGVIFVVRHNATTFESAAFAKERLEMVNADVLGCVMNAFDPRVTNKTYTFAPPVKRGRPKLIEQPKKALRSLRTYLGRLKRNRS